MQHPKETLKLETDMSRKSIRNMHSKVAVVTGANKGIGFAIVKGLCQKFDGTVYLTSRDTERGQAAVKELENIGLNPKYHQLDITDRKSVEVFRDYLKENHDGIDILINNAGVKLYAGSLEMRAERTLKTNYTGLLNSSEVLDPLVKNGGKIINISSSSGHLSRIPSEELRLRIGDKDLSLEKLTELMEEYLAAVEDGSFEESGWGTSPYIVSKVAVTAFTFIQQKKLSQRDIKVNCVHPGYVITDMTMQSGLFNTDEGATAPLYLALEAGDDVRGSFVWHDNTILDWYSKDCDIY